MNFYWVTSWSADGDSLIDRQWSAFIIGDRMGGDIPSKEVKVD